VPEFRGRSVVLRPLRPSDATTLGRYLQDPLVARYLPVRVRREGGMRFVRRVLREERKGECVPFAILEARSGEVVGQLRFFHWYRPDRSAEVGYWVGRKHWGQGFATEALRLACRHGFRAMRLHRINAVVVAQNGASSRVLEKVGFRFEGTARASARAGRGWSDERLYGLLAGELRPDRPAR